MSFAPLLNLRFFYFMQVEYATTESVVTVDWENGFVEASAANNDNVTQVRAPLEVKMEVYTTSLYPRSSRSCWPRQKSPII